MDDPLRVSILHRCEQWFGMPRTEDCEACSTWPTRALNAWRRGVCERCGEFGMLRNGVCGGCDAA